MTGILIAPLRPAALLAKQAATVHALSGGRLVLGVSTSWQEDEYIAVGVPFRDRGNILTDQLGACRALWAGAPASFHSRTVNFDGMYCQPRPKPGETIPIWFGGKFTPRLVRRVVTLGNGWILFFGLGETLDSIRAKTSQLREAMAEAGRNPDELEISAGSLTASANLDRTLETVPALFEAGVNVLQIGIQRYVKSADEALEFVHLLAEKFQPLRGS